MCQQDLSSQCCTPRNHDMSCCSQSRRFLTQEEKKEKLESYRESLKREISGVEEQLKTMAE